MGNKISGHANKHVFEGDLSKLNAIVNDVINEKDLFKNKDYNFLSEDVCNKYQVILEEELSKHLKVEIKDLGASLYILPRTSDDKTKLTKYNLTKQQVCEKISNHYIKVLYIMCLVKYVYNLENHGDLSVLGIIFQMIKVVDDMMEIRFCGIPHKKYTNVGRDAYKLDFSKLQGLKFFTEYFLHPEEAHTFTQLLRSVLSRDNANKLQDAMCAYVAKHGIKDMKKLEDMIKSRFPKTRKLQCMHGGAQLMFSVEKDNPIFQYENCGAPMKVVIKLNTPHGKKVLKHYQQMKATYKANLDSVHAILNTIVEKKHGQFELKDMNKQDLDTAIDKIKWQIKQFYLQSILDFQNLLDMAKESPNIHIT